MITEMAKDTYANPLALQPGVIDLRVWHHDDPDFAIMEILDVLGSEDWRILRYDCDLEQRYCHVQAKRYDLPRVDQKALIVRLRDRITADRGDSHTCWIVIESHRGQVRLNWHGATYDTTGEREAV